MSRTTTIVHMTDDTRVITILDGGATDEIHAAHVARHTNKVLKAGFMIIRPNGDRVSRQRFEDMENGRYVWHDDGIRHRCTLYEITETPVEDGFERKRRKLRTVWVKGT